MSEEKKYNSSVKVASLWNKVDDKGNKYLCGKWGDVWVTIYVNGFKTEEKHPDCNMYLTPVKFKQQEEK